MARHTKGKQQAGQGKGRRPPASHDPEDSLRRGMTPEAAAEDEAETMASTGDSQGAFREIVTGTATGLGIDRGESVGTGGLAAGEDLDEVAEGDYWRQNYERRPTTSRAVRTSTTSRAIGSAGRARRASAPTPGNSRTSRRSSPGNGVMSEPPGRKTGRMCARRPATPGGESAGACSLRAARPRRRRETCSGRFSWCCWCSGSWGSSRST